MTRSSVATVERVTPDPSVAASYLPLMGEVPRRVSEDHSDYPAFSTRAVAQFMAKVAVAPSGCWVWQAARNTNGYGVFDGRAAHRVAYRWFVGPIDAPQLDHLCRNKACVNPLHVEPVTASENVKRAVDARGCCKRGHAHTPENTYLWRSKSGVVRVCLVCKRAATKRWEARNGGQ